jgi:serralysin
MAIRKISLKHTLTESGSKIKTYKYIGGAEANTIKAGNGDDRLYGHDGDDALHGRKGNDDPYGGSGNDRLYAGAGDDHLSGGVGADFLSGGAGQDNFIFDTAIGNGNVDRIADLNTKIGEKIMLDRDIFTGIRTMSHAEIGNDGIYEGGRVSKASFRIGKAAQDADDRLIYDPSTGAVSFDSDGNGANEAIHFATVKAGMHLKASDFVMLA